jgi:MYXO-CTERM domain-containing protein
MHVLKLETITPNEGDTIEDTPVVLTGDDFDEVVEVLIGSTLLKSSSVTAKSANVIETSVPKGLSSGVYDVSVINTRGEKATLTNGFTISAGVNAKEGCGCGSGPGALFGLALLLGLAIRRRRSGPSY